MSEYDDYPIDLERISIKEFAIIIGKFFTERNLYSRRTITTDDLFREIMRIPPKAAGRLQWWTFVRLFSQARHYLGNEKKVGRIYIQGRRIPSLTSVPTSTKIIGKLGYSISNKSGDFLKNNDVLDIMRRMIDTGILKNQKMAKELKEQKTLSAFLKGKWFGKEEDENED